MVTVQELHVYPLKSARGIAKMSVTVTDSGLEWDRHWMVIDGNASFLTQRTHPHLARIETEIGASSLILRAPGLAPLSLPLDPQGTSLMVRIWDDRCEALDQGEEAAAWVSQVLATPVRVVRVPSPPKRQANPRYAGPRTVPLTFPDGYPALVCNQASLENLNARMPKPIPMERFRPNIVLEGLAPFAEDRIASIRIGGVVLNLVKPCARCVIPSTDQRTGERSTDPLPVLRTFRFDAELRGITFGENAVPVAGSGSSIERGAICEVTYES
jgi:uncharacterized protein YcbX